MTDYMAARTALLADRSAYTPETLDKMKDTFEHSDRIERLETLRCLSRDILLRYSQNPEMIEAPPIALAARAVVQAESLLVELEKAELGKEITEEENMKHGVLFRMFRDQYYKKQEGQAA